MVGRFRQLAVNLLSAICKQVLRLEGHRIPVPVHRIGGAPICWAPLMLSVSLAGTPAATNMLPGLEDRLEPQEIHFGSRGASACIAPRA